MNKIFIYVTTLVLSCCTNGQSNKLVLDKNTEKLILIDSILHCDNKEIKETRLEFSYGFNENDSVSLYYNNRLLKVFNCISDESLGICEESLGNIPHYVIKNEMNGDTVQFVYKEKVYNLKCNNKFNFLKIYNKNDVLGGVYINTCNKNFIIE